jgi:hypothetical protein
MTALLTSWYNLKNKAFSCDILQEELHLMLAKALYINRCLTLTGKKLLHKCSICRAMKFELIIMRILQKLATNMPCIVASSAVKELRWDLTEHKTGLPESSATRIIQPCLLDASCHDVWGRKSFCRVRTVLKYHSLNKHSQKNDFTLFQSQMCNSYTCNPIKNHTAYTVLFGIE